MTCPRPKPWNNKSGLVCCWGFMSSLVFRVHWWIGYCFYEQLLRIAVYSHVPAASRDSLSHWCCILWFISKVLWLCFTSLFITVLWKLINIYTCSFIGRLLVEIYSFSYFFTHTPSLTNNQCTYFRYNNYFWKYPLWNIYQIFIFHKYLMSLRRSKVYSCGWITFLDIFPPTNLFTFGGKSFSFWEKFFFCLWCERIFQDEYLSLLN